MKRALHRIILGGLLFGPVNLLPAASPGLIATGWDSPTAARFRRELSAFEKWQVFAGTTIAPTRTRPDGREADTRFAFSAEHWTWDQFARCVRELQDTRPKTATHNFLFVYANPGNVDWFDDTGWREVVDHWRLLARVARQGGLEGFLFDAEPYTPPHAQFRYSAQPQRARHTFAEYCKQARQRGREVMRAVVEEYPTITIMTYRLFCDLLPAAGTGNTRAALEPHTYGLLPAFVDGWLDVMPPTVSLIEGDENAYRFNSEAEFNRAFTRLKLNAPLLVSPENRAKLRAQMRIGHGIYLDAHINPPSSPWHIDSSGSTPARRLAANAAAALAAADGFVWIYGERGRWWPGGNRAYPLWPDKFKGADRALMRAVAPVRFARQTLESAPVTANRLRNPSFTVTNAKGAPESWWVWQAEKSHGKVRVQDGAACLMGMQDGVLGQTLSVQPGEAWAVSIRVRAVGHGAPALSIGWKTAEGQWLWSYRSVFLPANPEATDWQQVVGLVDTPPEAGQLVFMLSAKGQFDETDRAWFDDARLVPVRLEE